MSDEHEYSRDAEIRDTTAKRPHVVILGAGASRAAFPTGERNGRRLPVMNDLIEVVGLQPTLTNYRLDAKPGTNFETVYSALHQKDSGSPILREIETNVDEYFSALQLPDRPTIYDHLVLSLREKDLIATFNWDPFLYEACYRNKDIGHQPHVVYLHGSVAIGYGPRDRRKGARGGVCSVCSKPFTPSQLLYPIAEKNYTADPFMAAEWSTLAKYLKHAFVLTIFGYSAPQSDVAAIELMKKAWGNVKTREFEQTEIIDIKRENELAVDWSPFIHTHHYDVRTSFNDSWIAKHPRRTIESAWQQIMMTKFIDENPAPADIDLDGLRNWYGTLRKFE